MQALEGEKTDNLRTVSLLEKLSRLCERDDIVLCWLTGHIGISGNEEADKAAKDALSPEILPFKVPIKILIYPQGERNSSAAPLQQGYDPHCACPFAVGCDPVD